MQILNTPIKPINVLEKTLEMHFSKECKRLGLPTLKISVRFSTGWPDRLVASRHGLKLVELKTMKGVLSPKQKYIISALNTFGIDVTILRSRPTITEYLEGLK